VTKNKLPTCKRLRVVLREAQQSDNGGLGFHIWGTVVDRNASLWRLHIRLNVAALSGLGAVSSPLKKLTRQ
jgi:hypothetical protein